MVLYKRVFFTPWGPLLPHKQLQASLGILGLLERTETTSLGSLNRWLEIYFRKYNLELHLFKAVGI